MMLDQCTAAKNILKADRFKDKQITTEKMLQDIINNLRGCVMIGYPAYHGLPKYEATRFLLEDQEDFSV